MNKLSKIPIVVSAIMLLFAIGAMPYGYYALLRFVVCGTAVYLVWFAKTISRRGVMWTMVFIALLFNPAIPIHLDKEIWGYIDLTAMGIFILSFFRLNPKRKAKKMIDKAKLERWMLWFFLILVAAILLFGSIIIAIKGNIDKEFDNQQLSEEVNYTVEEYDYLKNNIEITSNRIKNDFGYYLLVGVKNYGNSTITELALQVSYYDDSYLIKREIVNMPSGEIMGAEEERRFKILLQGYPRLQNVSTFTIALYSCRISKLDVSLLPDKR